MRSFLRTSAIRAGFAMALVPGWMSAQPTCSDATESGRLVRTGATRTVAVAAAGVNVCMTAEGFTDSLEIHPRDWMSRSRFIVLETVAPGDARRMETSAVLTTVTRNGQTSPNDTGAARWRDQALDVLGLHWDLVTMHARRFDLDAETAATLQLRQVIIDEMESIKRRAAELNTALVEQQKDRADRDALTNARRREANLRAAVGRAQAAVASAQTAEEVSRAQQNLMNLQNQLSRASRTLRAAEGRSYGPSTAGVQQQIDALNEKPRLEVLRLRLAELDPDGRVAWLRASRVDVSEDRARVLEERLVEAAERLKATLAR